MTFKSKTKAMAHQTKALKMMQEKEEFALLMEMGTGKSKVILDEFQSGGTQDLMVIAPAGSYRNWFKPDDGELDIHLDPRFREKLVDVGWRTGGGKAMRERLAAMLAVRDRPRALFMNIEALSNVEKARDLCLEFLNTSRGCTVVIDESTRIKNHRAKRTKFILREIASHPRCERRRILTGMVAPRSPLDLYSQFEFLNWKILGFKSFFAFQNRYAVLQRKDFGGRKFNMVVGYKNVEELQEKIRPWSYRVLKEDCLDLDPKVYMIREVEQTSEQRRMYEELRLWATTKVGNGDFVTTTSIISMIMRLQQINCGHVVDEEGKVHDIEERRTEALLDILEDHSGKAVIWIPWDRTIRKVAQRLREEYGPESVAMFWGGNRTTRWMDEERFLHDPSCRFMVATQGAGGIGNNWTVANLVVYYANNYDLEQRSQSEDRSHRKGQECRVTYVDLISSGTVDENIVNSLRNKIDMATMITGEMYREWLI